MAASATRKRRLLFGGVALLAIAGGVAAFVIERKNTETQLRAAASELRNCLLVAPLDAAETAAGRFRRLQLVSLGLSELERLTQRDKLWPLACGDDLHRLKDLLKNEVGPEELMAVERFGKFVSDPLAVSKDATEVLTPVMALLDSRYAGPVSPAPGAKLPERVLNVDALAQVSALSKKGTSLGRSYTEDNPGLALPVLVDEEGMSAPLLCQFREASKAATCRVLSELSAVKGHGLRLLGTSDEESRTIVFAGRRGAAGVFVAGTPAPIDALYSYGGYATQDGTAWVLGFDEANRSMVLVQKAAGAPAVRTQLNPNFEMGNYFYSSQLLWDQVVVRGVTPDQQLRLFTLPLDKRASSSFQLADIGELDEPGMIRPGQEEEPHVTGCRTKQATVVRVRGTRTDAVTFRIGDRFSMPVKGPIWGTLGCYGTTGTMVTAGFAASGTRLYHSACTSAGCQLAELKSSALDRNSADLRPVAESDVQAVDLQGKLLVVWLAGDRAGLRLRMAAPDVFERASDKVLFDDHVAEGRNAGASTVLGFRLYSRENFAVLLLSSMAGLHAFRIDPSGTVTPFEVKEP